MNDQSGPIDSTGGLVIRRAAGTDRAYSLPQQFDAWVRSRGRAADVALALLVALPLGGMSVTLLLGASTRRSAWTPVLIAAVIAGHAVLAARRRRPGAAFAIVTVVALLLTLAPDIVSTSAAGPTAFPPILLPSSLVFLFALYALAAYGRRPGPQVGLAVGVLGALLVTWRLAQPGPVEETAALVGWWQVGIGFAALVAATAAAWSLGLSRRVRNAYVAALEERARRSEAEREERARAAVRDERTRIAREMHDVVAHSLAVIVRQAEAGRYAGRADPRAVEEVLSAISATGREALTDMRALVGVLRDADGTGLSGPQPDLEDLPDLVRRVRDSGLPVTFDQRGTPVRLQRSAALAAYRLVQEALTNVVRHAGQGAAAAVLLDWDDRGLTVTVSDTGAGLSQASAAGTTGHGLRGMRERLRVVGGDLVAGPGPGGGFRVQGRIPARAPSDERLAP